MTDSHPRHRSLKNSSTIHGCLQYIPVPFCSAGHLDAHRSERKVRLRSMGVLEKETVTKRCLSNGICTFRKGAIQCHRPPGPSETAKSNNME